MCIIGSHGEPSGRPEAEILALALSLSHQTRTLALCSQRWTYEESVFRQGRRCFGALKFWQVDETVLSD